MGDSRVLEMTVTWGGVNLKCGRSVHANLGKVEQCVCVCKLKNRGFFVCVFCLQVGLLQKEIWVGYHSGKTRFQGEICFQMCMRSLISSRFG